MTITMPLLLLFVLGILLLLYVLKYGLYEHDSQEARIRCSQPGVGLWSPHFFADFMELRMCLSVTLVNMSYLGHLEK